MSKRRLTTKANEYQRQRQQRTRAFILGVVVVAGLVVLAFIALRTRPESSASATGAYQQWPLVIADAFDEQAYGWQYGALTSDIADATLSLAGGRYHWAMTPRHSVLWWSLADTALTATDLYARVEARQITGTPGSDFGLVFRLTGEDYYYYQISPATQKFALNLQYEGQWFPLIDWTTTPIPIETETLNELAVVAEGPRLTLYLNGETVGNVTDDRLPEGGVGVGVQIYYEDPEADNTGTYEFDNFEWRAPQTNR